MENKPLFLPGLNGIRALAAIGVLISHISLASSKFNIHNFSIFGFDKGKTNGWVLGEHGVTMFFVLSGFLITYLLLKENEKTDEIKIKEFYIRRILRIWPLYFLYLTLVIAVYFFLLDIKINSTILYYLFFTANIPYVNLAAFPAMNHLWSIAVEEQFYLFWPFLFAYLLKKKFVKNIIFIIAVLSIFRIAVWYFLPFSTIALYSVVNRFDCMFFGALGAFFLFKDHHIVEILNSKMNQLFCWSILFLLLINKFWFLNSIIEIFLVEYMTLCLIIGQIKGSNKFFCLETRPLSYLGKISFGIYVYHPLIILVCSHFFKFTNQINEFYFVIIITIAIVSTTVIISHLSYFYFEKRFLQLKHKYSIIKSTNELITQKLTSK